MTFEIKAGEMRPIYPEWYNQVYATELCGFRWMAWDDDIPIKGTPDYPRKQRVRQLLSPAQLENPQWQEFLQKKNATEADGTEPLSYSYCSSGCNVALTPDVLEGLGALLAHCVRKTCDDLPSDIGEQLLDLVREHLDSVGKPKKPKRKRTPKNQETQTNDT